MSLDREAWIACARSVPIEGELARRGIKLNGNKIERDGPCPKCGGDDRFSINTKKQVFNCRNCKTGGDVIDLVRFLDGVEFIEACTMLAGEPPKNGKDRATAEPHKVCTATFHYVDESGALLFDVERLEYRNPDGSFVLKDGKHKKTFRQKRPDPDRPGQWIYNVDGVRTAPYKLPELIEAVGNEHFIVIVEGEAKADLLWSWNVPATCCAMGAGKWKSEHSEFLRGADVIIVPDHDEPGRDHADIVGASLQGIAKSVRLLELPALGAKQDIVDWAKQGGTVEQLHDLIAHQARPWIPRSKSDSEPGGEESGPPERLILSSAEFIESFEAPDPLIESILMRKFIYALTGHVAKGKTSVALLWAAHVALGRMLGTLEVEQGRVLYLAGENFVDVQMRWIAMAQQMDFDPETIPVHFRPGRFKLSGKMEQLRREVDAIGGVDFIIIDSSAAFFEGDDENSNAQAGVHACRLRELTKFKGEPCVLVLCHPPKNAGDDNLQPRGAGALIAEWDGNLTATKDGSVTTIHYQIKIRGPDFAPVSFVLRNVTHERLKSKAGKLLPTVIAEPLSAEREEEMQKAARNEEDELMKTVGDHPHCGQAELARQLGWISRKGEPQKSKVHRLVTGLKKQKLLEEGRSGITLTAKGKAAIKEKGG